MPENWFPGLALSGVVLAVVAAFWSKLKAVAWRVASLGVVRFTVESEAAPAVQAYLWRVGRRSRFGEKAYGGATLFVRPADRRLLVAHEEVGPDPAVFWVGWRPVLAAYDGEVRGATFLGNKLTLSFVRGTFDPDALVKAAVDRTNETRHAGGDGRRRFAVHRVIGTAARQRNRGSTDLFGHTDGSKTGAAEATVSPGSVDAFGTRYVGWAREDIGPPTPPDPLGPLAFPPEVDTVARDARRWLAGERWYKDRRIPWRLGYCLWGPPGTGKSSLAKAVAQELDLPVFAIEPAGMDDGEFVHAWNQARGEAPCMVLLEDLDTVFLHRENRLGERGGGLSFGCVLNCISGVDDADGILLIVTTNKIADLDPALGVPDGTGKSTRPGRVDRAVELGPLDAACRLRVAERILADAPADVAPAVAAGDGMTGAQFQHHCATLALDRYWAGRREG